LLLIFQNLVGTSIAAKLMSVAGGLTSLSKLTSSIIQILGTNKRQQIGFSSASATHAGFIYYCDIITSTPPSYRVRAIRLLSGKCALASRVDSFNEDTGGQIGIRYREEIIRKISKLQEPPPPKQPKPLPAPDDKPKKKRGGKRARKMKEKYAITDLRKLQNRTPFGLESEETWRESGKGFGMVGMSGSGKVRITTADKGLLKGAKKLKTKHISGSSGATLGLSSSLAFTPVQGLELKENPERPTEIKEYKEKYFSSTNAFINVTKD